MKNLSRAEKAAAAVTLLVLCFTAGYFVGRSSTASVITMTPETSAVSPSVIGQAVLSPSASAGPDTAAPTPPEAAVSDTASSQPAAETSPGGAPAVPSGQKVNINTASASELDTLPGIGEKLSQRIIDYRRENGAFKKPEDIIKVSGIGQSKYDTMKEMITVG